MASKFLTVTRQGRALHFVLGNGLRVEVSPDDLSDEMRDAALFHGVNQKVRDSASSKSKDLDYSGAFSAMQGVVDNLMSGLWNAKGGSGTSDLIAAISNLKKITVEEATELVDNLDDDQLKAVMGKPAIKVEIARIKLERAEKIAAANDDDDLVI